MKHSTRTGKILFWRGISVLALLLLPPVAFTQNSETSKQKPLLTGNYEGTGKGPTGDVKLTLELAEAAGKFSGRVTSPRGVYEIVKGATADGVLTLELDAKGSPAKLSLKQKDDKLVGELTTDGQTGPVEFRKVVKDEISGEWDAAADAQGQAFPFTLSLKQDGETVTGTSHSELGTSSVSTGTWKDGKLVLLLDSANGQIALVATMTDGKLTGDYDYAGQMQGKWIATKKK